MKPSCKIMSKTTHRYQILVDGKALSLLSRDEMPRLRADATPRNTRTRQHLFSRSAVEAELRFLPPAQNSNTASQRAPMNELRREILNRAIALTCRTILRIERVLELLLLRKEAVAAERVFELGDQLQDILTLFSLLPGSKTARECHLSAPEQLRAWQFEQLDSVLQEIRQAELSSSDGARRYVLETRVLPWLDSMHNTLSLLQEMLPAQRCQPGNFLTAVAADVSPL
jgi:hypothetical protein